MSLHRTLTRWGMVFVLLLAVPPLVQGQNEKKLDGQPAVSDTALRQELLAMMKEDQDAHEKLMGEPTGQGQRKALIVDGQNTHPWRETSPLLRQYLEQTGLFTVDVATSPPKDHDMSGYKPNFAGYDVVIDNYYGDPWPEETQKALVDYVSGGGGLVIYHAVVNAFPDWKEYNEMMGVGGWGGRTEKDGPYIYWQDGKIVRDMTPGPAGGQGPADPHHWPQSFQLIVREPDHPIMKGLPPVFMHSEDELYSRLRGPAKNLTVLATAFAPVDKGGTGRHEPMLMTISYGKGRVFHTTLGHLRPQCQSVAFIVTFQRGAEWAATGKVTQKVPADFPGPDRPSIRQLDT